MPNNSIAKKRKNNDFTSPPQRVRSIESFFKVQASKQHTGAGRSREHKSDDAESSLADSALTQSLEAQWNHDSQTMCSTTGQEEVPRIQKSNTSIPNIEEIEDIDIKSTGAQSRKDTLSLQKSSVVSEDIVTLSIPFDQSPLTFEPSEYVKELRKHWTSHVGDASYALLTRGFVLVNGTQSRIKIVDTLVNLLRVIIEGDPTSLLPAVWLATNSFTPPYIPLELGLGGSAISKALKNIYGLNSQGLKTLYDKHGDAGDVAFEAKTRQSFTLKKPKPLTIKAVYQSLIKIATSKGPGSQEIKQRIVESLLRDARGAEESRYVVRTLVQHLRIGAVKTTMLIALARAFLYSKPDGATFSIHSPQELARLKKEQLTELYNGAEEIVKACYARHPNYDDLVPCLLEIGISEELLVRCGLALHAPLRPMLGSITRDLSDMLTRLQGRDFSCEYKYDGQRAQVHCDERGKISIFSRHLELMTDKYPDLVFLVPSIRGESVSSFILEGEIVAVDHETGDLQSFQILTNRAKKNVDVGSIRINVCLFAFDLMYLNGQPLLDRAFRERRELLRSLFVEIPNRFTWVKSLDAASADSEAIFEFFKCATDTKCEGIMVKVLDNVPRLVQEKDGKEISGDRLSSEENRIDPENGVIAGVREKVTRRKALLSTYEPDKRLESWLKVKKDYSASSDTLDLIPVAGWHGQGRKAKWWSPILMAVRNSETGRLEAVTKCISGFTDKFYQANKEKYQDGGENVISRPSYVDYAGEPEVWFEPQEVWEMAFADITLSPTYTAAIGLASEERGLSLRFPRFLRVREDKSIDEASSSEYLASLWRKQTEQTKREGTSVAKEDEFSGED
ncbi:hypothetical protein Egran_06598 [Elaphomyces granulatus]|uniref:DNA ligase n=1 Tax=Elaphomyces granulatus TaxID=519963 RepID=A0A232LNF6_9EURO|nr:hypothetical protein Egran_06598 [Elaphomyces granulatus]